MLTIIPKKIIKGEKNTDIDFIIDRCTLGTILVAYSQKGICAITLGDNANELLHDLQDRFPRANLIGSDNSFDNIIAHVIRFVEEPRLEFDLPLDLHGTIFQLHVWKILQQIPYGETASYTDIACQIGRPQAVRAVARACSANAIAVAIPCHRVIRQDGALSGYRWGIERKRILLEREQKAK